MVSLEKRSRDDWDGDDDALLLGIKTPRRLPVTCAGRAKKHTLVKGTADIHTNVFTQQRWLYDKGNSGKLLGCIDEGNDGNGVTGVNYRGQDTVTYYARLPDQKGPAITWTRAKIEASKYYAEQRAPLVERSRSHRGLPENKANKRVDMYVNAGMEKVVDRRVSMHTNITATDKCAALVLTGIDPFGATIACVVEGGGTERAVRVPSTWGDNPRVIKTQAAKLENALRTKLQQTVDKDYRLRNALGDLCPRRYGNDQHSVPVQPITSTSIIWGTGIDAYGYRGNHVRTAGMSFITFRFSHSAFAECADKVLAQPADWCAGLILLPDFRTERGEYYNPPHCNSFRVYDDTTWLEQFMCADNRRWGLWFSIPESATVDNTWAHSQDRVTLCDREYRCVYTDFLPSGTNQVYIDGAWKSLSETTPDLRVLAYDGEFKPGPGEAFPRPDQDAALMYSCHTYSIDSSAAPKKYLFSFGRVATEDEFQAKMVEREAELKLVDAHASIDPSDVRLASNVEKMEQAVSNIEANQHRDTEEGVDGDDEYDAIFQDLVDLRDSDVSETCVPAACSSTDRPDNSTETADHMDTTDDDGVETVCDEHVVDTSGVAQRASSGVMLDEIKRMKAEEDVVIADYINECDKNDAENNIKKPTTDELIGTVYNFDDEYDMIVNMCEFHQVAQGGIITGWNVIFDTHYTIDRGLVLGTRCGLQMGLIPGEEVTTRTVVNDCTVGVVNIPGTVCMDMMAYMRQTEKLDEYNLNFVARMVLNRHKATMSYELISYYAQTASGRRRLAVYCAEDTALVVQISQAKRPYVVLVQKCYETNNALATLVNYGPEKALYYAVYSRIKQFMLPKYTGSTHIFIPKLPRVAKVAYKGGAVFKPRIGYHYDASNTVDDINSMYPCMVMEFNLCITTMINAYYIAVFALVENKGFIRRPQYTFNQAEMIITYLDSDQSECAFVVTSVLDGAMPSYMVSLYVTRNEYKRHMSKATAEYKRMAAAGTYSAQELALAGRTVSRFNAIQLTKKLAMNSIYGVYASPTFRLYTMIISSTITALARLCIMRTAIFQTKRFRIEYGHPSDANVDYGDTDSTMIDNQFPPVIEDYDANGNPVHNVPHIRARHSINVAHGPSTAHAINAYYKRASAVTGIGKERNGPEEVGGGYVNGHIGTKFEKVQLRVIYTAAKRYAAIHDEGHKAALVMMGSSDVRRDTIRLYKKTAVDSVYLMVIGQPDMAIDLCKDVMGKTHLGELPLSDLTVTVALSKPAEEYAGLHPAVTAAKYYEEFHGSAPHVGERFAVVFCKPPGAPPGKLKISECVIPVDMASANGLPYITERYEEKMFDAVKAYTKQLFGGNEKIALRKICDSPAFKRAAHSKTHAFEERVTALEAASVMGTTRSERTRAAKLLKKANQTNIMHRVSTSRVAACSQCGSSDVDTSVPNATMLCAKCEASACEGAIGDIEDLFVKTDTLKRDSLAARKQCVQCQRDKGFITPYVINDMVDACEAKTCHVYLERKCISNSLTVATKRMVDLPESVRSARKRLRPLRSIA